MSVVRSPSLIRSSSVSSVARPRAVRLLRGPLAGLALLGDLAGDPVLADGEERVAGTGHGGQTEHEHRTGRTGARHRLAVLVEHGPDPAVRVAGDDRVTDVERAPVDQHRGDRTATAVEVSLDRDALRLAVDRRPQVQRRVGGEQHALEQAVDVDPALGGDVDEHGVAAVLLGHQPVLGELLAHLGRVGVLLVDLVHRHHDRHLGRLGVVERLDRLRHDAVVGRDDQDHDVGGLGTTGTHGGERLVTRGVDEGDRPVVALVLDVHLVRADVLGDAAGLALGHLGLADRVEQLGLAVVDVTHDGHDRRPGDQAGLVDVLVEVDVEPREQLAVLLLGADDRTSKPRCSPSNSSVSSVHDWVAVTISPRLNISWTSEPGFALILSAKSDSEAPRGSRTTWP